MADDGIRYVEMFGENKDGACYYFRYCVQKIIGKWDEWAGFFEVFRMAN